MRRRLFTRIYFHFLGVLLVVGLATFVVFFTGIRSEFMRHFVGRLTGFGAELVADRWDEPEARAAMVRRLGEELEIDVTLRAPSGAVIQSTNPEELPPLEGDEPREVALGPQLLGHHRWFVAAPVERGGRMVAVLEASPRRRMRAPHLLRPFALMIVVLLVVGMATAPLARRISRPVERLTEATRRLGEGDLSYRIPIHPRWRARWKGRHGHHHHAIDELEQLTCGFNDMAERVEQLVRGQKELLANVSHELRSPLARLRMALELLPRDPSGESEARLKDLELDIGELDRLIEEVLTMSRLDASRLPLHVEPVEARALLAQLALRARHDPALQGKEVLLAEGPPVELEADGALLRRALWNLIENAGKYGAAPITVAALRDGAEVLLSVSDEGAGISAEERERVFAPFYRVERAHTPGRGFGLGLALARRVAEVHGGSIRAEGAHPAEGGRAERGCRVVIALPAKASATTG